MRVGGQMMRKAKPRRRVMSEKLLSNGGALAVVGFFLTAIGAMIFSLLR
jgi:hypothetical protein